MFDEADMLLSGSFQNQVIRLIHMLRFDEKQLSHIKKSGLDVQIELTDGSLSQSNLGLEADPTNEYISGKEDCSEDEDDNLSVEESKSGSVEKKGWRRVRKTYERSKQYIFVAATLPSNGKKTAGAVLKYMFPDAIWVSGNYLHCHNPR